MLDELLLLVAQARAELDIDFGAPPIVRLTYFVPGGLAPIVEVSGMTLSEACHGLVAKLSRRA